MTGLRESSEKQNSPFLVGTVIKCFVIQWNPVNTATNGPWKFGRINGWPYKRGRVKFHDWSTSSDVLTDTYHN